MKSYEEAARREAWLESTMPSACSASSATSSVAGWERLWEESLLFVEEQGTLLEEAAALCQGEEASSQTSLASLASGKPCLKMIMLRTACGRNPIWSGVLVGRDSVTEELTKDSYHLMWQVAQSLGLQESAFSITPEDKSRKELDHMLDASSMAKVEPLLNQGFFANCCMIGGPLQVALQERGASYQAIGFASNVKNRMRAARLTMALMLFRPNMLNEPDEVLLKLLKFANWSQVRELQPQQLPQLAPLALMDESQEQEEEEEEPPPAEAPTAARPLAAGG